MDHKIQVQDIQYKVQIRNINSNTIQILYIQTILFI